MIHNVTNDATLVAAMGSAMPGDEIVMAPGTYSPNALTPAPAGFSAFALTVRSRDGLGTVLCDGGGAISCAFEWRTNMSFEGLEFTGYTGSALKNGTLGWAGTSTTINVDECKFGSTHSAIDAPLNGHCRRSWFENLSQFAIDGKGSAGESFDVESCVFKDNSCGANIVELRYGSRLRFCTFVGSTVGGFYQAFLANGALASGCIFYDFPQADDVTNSPSSVTYSVAYRLAGAPVNALGTGCVYTDPLFVNPASDWHLMSGSLALGLDPSSHGVLYDYDGLPRVGVPGFDAGAFVFLPGVDSASFVDWTHCDVVFDEDVAGSDVVNPALWTVAPTGAGAAVSVLACQQIANDTVRLTTTPNYTPQVTYRATAPLTTVFALGWSINPSDRSADFPTPNPGIENVYCRDSRTLRVELVSEPARYGAGSCVRLASWAVSVASGADIRSGIPEIVSGEFAVDIPIDVAWPRDDTVTVLASGCEDVDGNPYDNPGTLSCRSLPEAAPAPPSVDASRPRDDFATSTETGGLVVRGGTVVHEWAEKQLRKVVLRRLLDKKPRGLGLTKDEAMRSSRIAEIRSLTRAICMDQEDVEAARVSVTPDRAAGVLRFSIALRTPDGWRDLDDFEI